MLKPNEILTFAQENFEPSSLNGSEVYRCAATLRDGTYLPNVLVSEASPRILAALNQIDHGVRQDRSRNRSVPKEAFKRCTSLIAGNNSVSAHSIAKLEASPNAIPVQKIDANLLFTWESANYRLVLNSGETFEYATHGGCQFLNLPENYTLEDVSHLSLIDYSESDLPSIDCVVFNCFVVDYSRDLQGLLKAQS